MTAKSAELVVDTTSPVLGKPSSEIQYTSKTTAECSPVPCDDALSGDEVRHYVGIGVNLNSVDMLGYTLVKKGVKTIKASKPAKPGQVYYCRHVCFDAAGNVAFATSGPVIVDTTQPAANELWHYQGISSKQDGDVPLKDSLCAEWRNSTSEIQEPESVIAMQELQLMAGSPGSGKVLKTYSLARDARKHCVDPAGLVDHGGRYHFRLRTTNAVKLTTYAVSTDTGKLDAADPFMTALIFLDTSTNQEARNQTHAYLGNGATLNLRVRGTTAMSGVEAYEFATVRADAVEAGELAWRDVKFTKSQPVPTFKLEQAELQKIVNVNSPTIRIAVRVRSKIGRVSAIRLSGVVLLDLALPSISGFRVSTHGSVTTELSLVRPHVIYRPPTKNAPVIVTPNAKQGSFTFDNIHDGKTGSGIFSTEFCLGRAPNNCLVNGWKAIDTSKPGQVSFNLAKPAESGSLYYVNLRAMDNAGNMNYLSSTPTLVDLNAPTWAQWQLIHTDSEDGCNRTKFPQHGQVIWQIRQDLVCTCVHGLDDVSVVKMELRLQGVDGTKLILSQIKKVAGFRPMPQRFLPGSAEDARVVCFKPTVPLKPDAYVVELGARDSVGHVSTWQSNGELVVDTTPPTMGRVREHLGDTHEVDCILLSAGKNMAIHVDWDGFEGNLTSYSMIFQPNPFLPLHMFVHLQTLEYYSTFSHLCAVCRRRKWH